MKKTISLCLLFLLIAPAFLLSQKISIQDSLIREINFKTNKISELNELTKKQDTIIQIINGKIIKLNTDFETANKKLEQIDDNTNQSLVSEAFKNFMFSFLYEWLGYKRDSSTSLISRLISLLGLLLTLAKIYFLFKKKDSKGARAFNKFFTVFSFLLILILIILPWSYKIIPSDNIERTVLQKVKKEAIDLNKELEQIKTAEFSVLAENISKLKQLKIDSLEFVNEQKIASIEQKISSISDSLNKKTAEINKMLKNINEVIELNHNGRYAKTGGQFVTNTLLIILLIILLSLVIRMRLKGLI